MAPRGRPRKDAACRTCKIRRIKCDETRPACRRCTSTGRKCDGYASTSSPEPSSMPTRLFSNNQELRSFEYFCEKTSLEITSHYDETFWQSLVLQLSHVNSGLGHLIVAIGSLHESFKNAASSPISRLSPTQMSFSLQQCNKAISILTQQQPDGSGTGILMTSCILVMAFEMLQNRLDAAMNQFNIGLRMLRAWKERPSQTIPSSERDLIENHLEPILDRFSQSSSFEPLFGSHVPEDPALAPASLDGNDRPLPLPSIFLNLGQARAALHTLLEYLFTRIKTTTSNDTVPKSSCHSEGQALLNAWDMTFQNFLGNIQENISRSNRRKICLIGIQHLVGTITFAACVSKEEQTHDKYLNEFSTIIKLCREVIEIEAGRTISEGAPPMAFSFDLSIIMPLYFTAWKCRDPILRRQALRLLQSCPRREGVWLSWVTGAVAQQIIEIEENAVEAKSCEDVPVSSRVQLTHMHYDPCPVGGEGHPELYRPFIQLTWVTLDSESNPRSYVSQKTIHLAPTVDDSPGMRPYWVIIPPGLETSYWRILLAKKVFEQPSRTSENNDMLASTGIGRGTQAASEVNDDTEEAVSNSINT